MSRRWLALVAVALLVAVAPAWLVQMREVSSDSMWPTICAGDRVVALRAGVDRRVTNGDIVVFTAPGQRDLLLKRVVAVEGQAVEIRDGVLLVDDAEVAESYVDLKTIDGVFFGPVVVGDEELFMLGDDREHSIDSRDFGPVPRDLVQGVVHGVLGDHCPARPRRDL